MASTSSTTAPTPAPNASLVLFARGVIARLALWPALRLAVDHSWGGPESAQKRTWIASVIVDAFDPAELQETPDVDYVEEMLLQIMADEFDAILEDGSTEAVARDIVNLWDVKEGEVRTKTTVENWEEQVNRLKGKKLVSQEVVHENAEVDGSGSEWEDEDDEDDADEAPRLLDSREQRHREEPEIDEDGFTMVKGKAKSHR